MPLNPKRSKTSTKSLNLENEFNFEEDLDEQPSLKAKSTDQQSKCRKRTVIEQTPDDGHYSDQEEDIIPDKNCAGRKRTSSELEMSTLLNSFGADITNTLSAKRKRIQSFTQASLKTSSRKFDEIWRRQQNERGIQYEEFSKQVMLVLHQWEADLHKTRDAEEKLESLYKQQQKLFNQQRVVQSQRLKRVQQLHEDYGKNLQELKKNHEEQQGGVQEQLRKEISGLQKKILSDTQQQDFSNVRRSLQAMLAQV